MGHWVTDAMKLGMQAHLRRAARHLACRARRHPPAAAPRHRRCSRPRACVKVIVDEDLYDHDFVERWTLRLRRAGRARPRVLRSMRLQKMTWVPKEKIVAAARMFANGSSGKRRQWGLAVDMQSAGHSVRCCYRCAVDDHRQPRYPRRHVLHRIPDGCRPAFRRRVGHLRPHQRGNAEKARRLERVPDVPLRPYPGNARHRAWSTARQARVRRASGSRRTNGIACMSCETERWYEAMKKVEFVAACDIVHDADDSGVRRYRPARSNVG